MINWSVIFKVPLKIMFNLERVSIRGLIVHCTDFLNVWCFSSMTKGLNRLGFASLKYTLTRICLIVGRKSKETAVQLQNCDTRVYL